MAWPANPTNGQQTTINGTTFQYDSANAAWNRVFTSINNNLQYVGQISANAQPNIVYANNLTTLGTLTSLSLAGNATVSGANVITANIFTGAYANGNSNINIPASNGNINFTSAGNANILIVTGTGVNVAGTLNIGTNTANVGNLGVTSNATVGNLLFGTGVVSGTGNVVAGNLLGPHANGNSNVNIPAANGNITFTSAGNANILVITGTGANITGTGNITGNVAVGGNLTIAANTTHNNWAGFYSSQDRMVPLTGATGVVNHDMSQGALFYHTSPAANFTPNFTNIATTFSNVVTVATLLIVQGTTAYMPQADATNVQIGGSNVAVKWVYGAAPTGTASSTQIVAYSIINNNGTYAVLGQSSFYQ